MGASDSKDTLLFKKLTEKEDEHNPPSLRELERNQELINQMQSLIDNKQIAYSEIAELSKKLVSCRKFVFLLHFMDYVRDNYPRSFSKS